MALGALRLGLAGQDRQPDDPALAVEVLGRRFANPIGLAAGFDKDGVALAPLMRLGFGFVEAGTVTPRPQPGNPRPRLFRVPPDGLINRMGFNGAGLECFLRQLSRLRRGAVPLGINIGPNKEGADPERDFPALAAAVAPHADYIAINVSSPNTPGLRDLQGEARLAAILRAIAAALPECPPLLVKIAPDLSQDGLEAVVRSCIEAGADGLIVGNTTLSRPAGMTQTQAGGLSGTPLLARSTAMLARAHLLAAGRLRLIGCGGVSTGGDALQKILAGAHLVQLYTAFAYHGPALLPRLKAELAAGLRGAGFSGVTAAVGAEAPRLAASCSI